MGGDMRYNPTLDWVGNKVVHLAAYRGDVDAVRYAVDVEHSINSRNSIGNTPLMMTLYGQGTDDQKLRLIDLLVKKRGADVNVMNKNGDSALHLAVYGVVKKHTSQECVESLLALGADVEVTNASGKTVTEVARDNENSRLYDYLEAWHDSILKKGNENLRDTLAKQVLVYQAIRKVCDRRNKNSKGLEPSEGGGVEGSGEEVVMEEHPTCEAWLFEGSKVYTLTYYTVAKKEKKEDSVNRDVS